MSYQTDGSTALDAAVKGGLRMRRQRAERQALDGSIALLDAQVREHARQRGMAQSTEMLDRIAHILEESGGPDSYRAIHEADIAERAWEAGVNRVIDWNRAANLMRPTDNPHRANPRRSVTTMTDFCALKQDEPETPEQMETRRSALLEAVCNFLGDQGYELDSLDDAAEMLRWLAECEQW